MLNKTALITGAGRGIGNGIALKLAQDGYDIAIMDVHEESQVSDNLKKVTDTGRQLIYMKGDITSREDRTRVLDTVMQKYGRLDVHVNNAGVGLKKRMDILETTEESFDFVMNINLRGTFFFSQQVANIMVKEVSEIEGIKPKIINVSSMSAYTSSTDRGEYCISKAGISMVTTLFADRLAEYGIYVYEIRPGIIFSDMTKVVKEKYDRLIGEGILPTKRWGYPEDIANAVSVMCSGKLDYSTGQVINVDGGFHIRRL